MLEDILKFNFAVKNLIKSSDDSKAYLTKQAEISFDKLKDDYQSSSTVFIESNVDGDMIDFIKDEIAKSDKLVSEINRLDLKVKTYSREKYLKFLKQELDLETKQVGHLSRYNLLDSNKTRIEVIYTLLMLKEMEVFRFENDSKLAKFIERHCTYEKGKKIKNARQTISNIKNKEINTTKQKNKFKEYLKTINI